MSRKAPELHSPELPVRTLDPIDDVADRDAEIVIADEKLAASDYVDELKFNEDQLTIVLHKGREKFAPGGHMFWCQGRGVYVPCDTKVKVARKYVEIMARAQPMDVRTESRAVEEDESAATINRVHRSLSNHYPFTVIEDPSPKGAAWLAKVMREG
jgi:hypothetical protein